jgi:hypothetical protein
MSAVQLQPGKKKRLKGIEERAARLPPREPPPYLDESSPFGKYRIDSWLDDNFNAGLLNGRWCVPPSVPWHKLPPTPKTGLAQVLIRYTFTAPAGVLEQIFAGCSGQPVAAFVPGRHRGGRV